MSLRPQTVSDLYLAPVALRLDAELESLGGRDHLKLRDYVALRTSRAPLGVEERREALLKAIGTMRDLRGWELSWDDRGLRVSNGDFQLVLGLPANVRSYLEL